MFGAFKGFVEALHAAHLVAWFAGSVVPAVISFLVAPNLSSWHVAGIALVSAVVTGVAVYWWLKWQLPPPIDSRTAGPSFDLDEGSSLEVDDLDHQREGEILKARGGSKARIRKAKVR